MANKKRVQRRKKKKGKSPIRFLFILLTELVVLLGILLYLYIYHPDNPISTALHKMIDPIPEVVLDAGHGGYDAGSESKEGKKEKDITLSITLKTGELLKQEGVQVLYTRESDTVSWKSNNVDDLNTRSRMANASQADIFVSIHTNYSDEAKDKTAGSEVWYSTRQSGSKKIAEHMELALRADGYTKSRGLRDDREAFLSLLYYNQIPSILVETGFISNPKDASILSDAKGQERIAQAISTGILKALGLKN